MYYTKQNSHQTPLNKTVWPSNNTKPAFLRVWCLNKIKTNQIVLGKKIKFENWVNFKKATSQGNLMCAGFRKNMLQLKPIQEWRVIIIEMISKMISTCRFKDFFLGKQNKINVLTFSQRMFILEFNSEMEIIKEAGPYVALTAFTLQ